MAKKIIWSPEALNDRKQTLSYWTKRNKSDRHSINLRKKIKKTIVLLSEKSNLGQAYQAKNVHYIVFLNYKLFYSYDRNTITILRIWDTRRNPEELKIK